MAGKSMTMASRRLAYAVDKVSKNALADLVIDRIRIEIGDAATDEQIAATLAEWFGPVWRMRGDKPVSFVGEMERLDRNDADYLARRGKHAEVDPTAYEREMEVVRRIRLMPEAERTKTLE